MKITLLSLDIANRVSGESRFVRNLARGLVKEGVQVCICAASSNPAVTEELRRSGVELFDLGRPPRSYGAKVALVANLGSEASEISRLCTQRTDPDWFIVLSDALVGAIRYLPSTKSAYLSQGDLSLMFLSPSFLSSESNLKRLVSFGAPSWLRQRAALARQYRLRLANSEFSRGMMSYLYAVPFSDVVYPPVDTEFFSPTPSATRGGYGLSLSRNSLEQGVETLHQIAAVKRLKVVGGAIVDRAESLGVVSDEDLRALYSGADFFVSAGVSELFGYSIAESLACGTPVLCYRACGPGELVEDRVSGWLVGSSREMVDLAEEISTRGVAPEMREHARFRAQQYSLGASSKKLIQVLKTESAE